MVAVVNWN